MQSFSGLDNIEERVQALQAMKRFLKKLIEQCLNRGTLTACPLLMVSESSARFALVVTTKTCRAFSPLTVRPPGRLVAVIASEAVGSLTNSEALVSGLTPPERFVAKVTVSAPGCAAALAMAWRERPGRGRRGVH